MGFTELDSGASAATVGTVDSNSITPTANALLLLYTFTWVGNSTDPPAAGVDGTAIGCTFELVRSVIVEPSGANRGILSVYRAQPASPSTGTITFTFTGSSRLGGGWCLIQDTEVPVGNNGDDAIIQDLSDAEDGTITAFHFGFEDTGVPLSSFADAANKTVVGLLLRGPGAIDDTIAWEGDLTQFTNIRLDAAVDWLLRVAWRDGENLSPAASWTASAAAGGAIAFEIDEEVAAPATGVYPHRRYYQRRVK